MNTQELRDALTAILTAHPETATTEVIFETAIPGLKARHDAAGTRPPYEPSHNTARVHYRQADGFVVIGKH